MNIRFPVRSSYLMVRLVFSISISMGTRPSSKNFMEVLSSSFPGRSIRVLRLFTIYSRHKFSSIIPCRESEEELTEDEWHHVVSELRMINNYNSTLYSEWLFDFHKYFKAPEDFKTWKVKRIPGNSEPKSILKESTTI